MSDTKIPNKLKKRLANLYELAERGATPGERNAARKAVDRLLRRYDLEDISMDDISKQEYRFKYNSTLEMWLILRLRYILLEINDDNIYRTNYAEKNGRYVSVRDIVVKLEQMDYITLECAYEYFRRHMNGEWKRLALPILNRCRKASTKRKKREKLQHEFFQQYCIASKLYKKGELKEREITSNAELQRARLFSDIEGGVYKKQVNNGLYLNG